MNKRVLWGVFGAAALTFGIWQLYGVFAKKAVFSPEKAQEIIRHQASAIAPTKTATCPSKGTLKKDDTVLCNLVFVDGTSVGVVLTAMNDKYDFQLSFAEPISSAEFFEEIITDGIKEQAKVDVTVDCGTGIVKGPTVTCTATDPAGVKVTVIGNIDHTGGGTWNIQNPPAPTK